MGELNFHMADVHSHMDFMCEEGIQTHRLESHTLVCEDMDSFHKTFLKTVKFAESILFDIFQNSTKYNI